MDVRSANHPDYSDMRPHSYWKCLDCGELNIGRSQIDWLIESEAEPLSLDSLEEMVRALTSPVNK